MKKWYLIGALTLVLVLFGIASQQSTDATPSNAPATTQSSADSLLAPSAGENTAIEHSDNKDERQLGEQLRQRVAIDTELQQMWASVKQQNLQQWLHQLWADCRSKGPESCDEHLQAMRRQLSQAEADWLQQLLVQYQDYQLLLGELVMTNSLSKAEQYDEVKRLRQRLFFEDYDNLFGLEEQWAMQQFELGELLQQRSQLDGAQRLQALYTQQHKQSQSVKQLLSADLLYQQAKDMLADLPPDDYQYYLAQAREHYFAADAANIAEFEAIQQQHQQQRLSYLQQLALLQQQHQLKQQRLLASDASPAQLAQAQQDYASALAGLRLRYFRP